MIGFMPGKTAVVFPSMPLNRKQLAQQLGVGKTTFDKLRRLGVIGDPDLTERGRGAWSEGRLPAFREALAAHRLASLKNLRAAIRDRDERARSTGLLTTKDVLLQINVAERVYYALRARRLVPGRPTGGWSPEAISALQKRIEAVQRGEVRQRRPVVKFTPTMRQKCEALMGMLLNHFDGDAREARRFFEGFAGLNLQFPTLAESVAYLNEQTAFDVIRRDPTLTGRMRAGEVAGTTHDRVLRIFRKRSGLNLSDLQKG